MTLNSENKEFRILSAIGIILVVAGHIPWELFTIGELFPYYSFHVFIFLFVSGYFYKTEAEEDILFYIKKKCKSLLLPYFLWNTLYGMLVVLLKYFGFKIGNMPSVYTLFLAPFIDGEQFVYNFSAWFVPALFIVEIANVCVRKVLRILKIYNETFIFSVGLLVGVIIVYLVSNGYELNRIFSRLFFMLPGFQFGRLYKEKLEKYDVLSDGWYFLILASLQMILVICNPGINFSTIYVAGFTGIPILPYITIATGIAFWLRISKIIKEIPYLSEKMICIGRNTFSIMMHHIMAFMVVKAVFCVVHIMTPFCADFDVNLFREEVKYIYIPRYAEPGKWIYLLAGIAIPLFIVFLQKKVINKIKKVFL